MTRLRLEAGQAAAVRMAAAGVARSRVAANGHLVQSAVALRTAAASDTRSQVATRAQHTRRDRPLQGAWRWQALPGAGL